ncbi:hypothetical protein RFI_05506, partial [Reticulomyxa filosa]
MSENQKNFHNVSNRIFEKYFTDKAGAVCVRSRGKKFKEPMSAIPNKLWRGLYRSLLRYSRRLDASPIHRCFLLGKPLQLFDLEERRLLQVDDETPYISVVEKLIQDFNAGEMYRPTPPGNIKECHRSITNTIRTYFKYGIPKSMEPNHKTANNKDSSKEAVNPLEIGFRALKRLANSHNLMTLLPEYNPVLAKYGGGIRKDYTSTSECMSNGKWTKVLCLDETHEQHWISIMSDLKSLEIVGCQDKDKTSPCGIVFTPPLKMQRGMILCTHPLSCLRQPIFHRK